MNIMNKHFCKVGKIKPNLNKLISLEELDNIINYFVDDTSKLVLSKDLNASF